MEVSKLEGIRRQAVKEGWSQFIRTPVDEKALLRDHIFSFKHYDHFRFFVENFIKLGKGRWLGQPMKLLPFHEEICGSIFGWIKPDGLRRFRRGYIEVPKKTSKTTLCSAIGLYMLCGDGEGAPEVYNCSNDKDQSGLLWNIAADAVEADDNLKEQIRVLRSVKRMLVDNNSWFAAWSSDQSGKDGPNAHCILVDELHEWKGAAARDFWRKIRYAGIARDQPLCPLVITTAGDDKYSLCWEQHVAAKRILQGLSEDLSFFAYVRGADPERIKNEPDYWKTEECWKEANPAYGYILKKEDFEADVAEVQNDPKAKAGFLRYRLGVWIDSDSPWLASGVWDSNKGPGFKEEDLAGQLAFGGFDLSSVHDFTAISLVFPYLLGDQKKFRILVRIFCPEDTFGERVRADDTGSLRIWFEKGLIRLTPGSAIDHEMIYKAIESDCNTFQVKEFAYDRNSAAWVVQEIQKKIPHVALFPFNQSMVGMSSATKAFTASLINQKIEHNGNEVLAWMANNAVVENNNAHENMMLHKGKSKDKIDGIIASIMAYAHAELGSLTLEKKFSPYSDEGFKIIKEIEGIKDRAHG